MNQTITKTPSIPPNMTLAFIGGGNMARAIIACLVTHVQDPKQIWVFEPVARLRDELTEQYHVSCYETVNEKLSQAHVIILAVKPQVLTEVLLDIKPHLNNDPLVISIAAGVSMSTIAQTLQSDNIIRTMPNTPAMIGMGMTGMAALPSVQLEAKNLAQHIMQTIGEIVWVEGDSQLDDITAISGSGPAYVFYFMESLIQSALSLGFSEDQARLLVTQTVLGAANLAQQSPLSVATLREQVTSKGGTTAAALAVLMENQTWQNILQQAVFAAKKRATELAQAS